MRICLTEGIENATLACMVRDHLVIEAELYVDGSWIVAAVPPLVQMTYSGTPESRRQIHEWMIASALNPATPFHYLPGNRVNGGPGMQLRPGDIIVRSSSGGFGRRHDDPR